MTIGREVTCFEHPLAARIDAAEVAKIASNLPESSIERHLAALPELHPSGAVKRIRLPVPDVLEGRGGTPWWVMLSGIDHDSPMVAASWAHAGPWLKRTAAAERGVHSRRASVFVASPGAVVPAHIDYDHNVLLQIAGTKEVMFVPAATVEDRIERCIAEVGRNLVDLPPGAGRIELGPGDGVYLPPFTPHWVIGHEGTSISFSCAWATRCSDDERLVRYWNAKQRRLGVAPRPPDGNRACDRLKAAAVRLRSKVGAFERHHHGP